MIRLEEIGLPELLVPEEQPVVPAEEYERRLADLRARVDAEAIVVYADREHFANMAFLCGLDPRFEEALLVLGDGRPALILGTESIALASLVPVDVDVLLCPSLGLMGQDRSAGLALAGALAQAGVRPGAKVGLVGWKYFEPGEGLSFAAAGFVVDALRQVAGEVADVTAVLMSPRDGLRATSSADQLAAFEWAAARASRSVASVVQAAEPGRTERQAAAAMGYAGEPLSAHVMLASGAGLVGLRSPSDRVLERGEPVTTAIGYWGGMCCRAGLLDTENEDYLEQMAIPYWRAIVTWYESIQLGVTGAEIDVKVRDVLVGTGFGSALNPGHLVHLDEWVHSPVRPGSDEPIRSGMCLQCDVIPAGARDDWTANCEDTVAVADAALRAELAARHPELWSRVQSRREFVRDRLGIASADELLPLSATPAWFPPFWLAPERALVKV